MKARAWAKINLALEVGPRRPDGFHDLVTLFQTLELGDDLEAEPGDGLELEVKGDAPAGGDNLVVHAARLLARAAGTEPRARIRLHKHIPAGGGLGGGSSDAAATLRLLDQLWRCRAGEHELFRLACELGSDVPFFLLGGTALGLGRGEKLCPVSELPPYWVVLALPGTAVSTAEAFRDLDALDRSGRPASDSWPWPRIWRWETGAFEGLGNDFEPVVLARRPLLSRLKRTLIEAGSSHALLSGSGSTVYGLFGGRDEASRAAAGIRGLGVEAVLTRTLSRAEMASGRESS